MTLTFIKDKIVLISGASSGIGEATAKLFAQHGARCISRGYCGNKLDHDLSTCQDIGRVAKTVSDNWSDVSGSEMHYVISYK